MNEPQQSPPPNNFVRFGIVVVVVYIAFIICTSFQKGPAPYEITSGIITLLVMLILLVLAESFNSISFGSILRLRRDIERTKAEKDEAKSEAKELRNTLLTIATNVQQSQVTTNISGLDVSTLRRVLGIAEASPEDKAKSKSADDEKVEPEVPTSERTGPSEFEVRKKLRDNIERALFERFSSKYGIPAIEIRKDVKIESGLEVSDPIMERPLIYDGYVRFAGKEYFIEVNSGLGIAIPSVISDRLYVALAKVFFYRQIKKIDAELVLLYPILPDSIESLRRIPIARLIQWFQPAVSNNLLRMEGFQFTEEEIEVLKRKNEPN